MPPVLSVRNRGPDGVDDGGGGDDLVLDTTSAAPGRRATLHEIGIAQAAPNGAPGLTLTGDWTVERTNLGLADFLDADGWGNPYEVQVSTRTVLSGGPDADYFTPADNIPPGVVSAAAAPPANGIQYVDGSAAAEGSQCSAVAFDITNTEAGPVTVTTMTISWSPAGAWFVEVVFDGNEVFAQVKPKPANGGTAILAPAFTLGVGQAARLEFREFRNNSFNGGQRRDMSGATFTVEFSDGSSISFTVGTC